MRCDLLILALLAVIMSVGLLLLIDEPSYSDAYYYYNAAERLATGKGLTDPYLWNYLHLPDELPMPSHSYWMPLSSLVAALSMKIFGISFSAAQVPTLLALIGLVMLTGFLGHLLGNGQRRLVFLPAILVLLGGFYLPFWAATDGFALYGLIGASALVMMGLGQRDNQWQYFAATGLLAGLGHLTRADGLLLLGVAFVLIWWPSRFKVRDKNSRFKMSAGLFAGYLAVMLPWFVRSISAIGSPLPTGGINTIFLRGYNELFAYPTDWSAGNFVDWGIGNILQSRLEALTSNFSTWVAVECFILLAPLALWALWQRRKDTFLTGFWLYALGLHVAMTFFFAYPGYRGGLFHSSSALLPFWMVLGVLGLDAAIHKMVEWRNWKANQAQWIFGGAVVIVALFLGLSALGGQLKSQGAGPDYVELASYLPADARLMVNDPAAWYYHTKHWGVTLPDAPLERLPEIAERFCVEYLILDKNVTDSFVPLMRGEIAIPTFLNERYYFDQGTKTNDDDVRLYQFSLDYPAHCAISTP